MSGAAVLLWSHAPFPDAVEVRDALLNNVDQRTELRGLVQSGGRLNVAAALAHLKPEFKPIVVTAVDDAADTGTGDGKAFPPSLRAAIMETNAVRGRNRIELGQGTFVLEAPGRDEEHGAATGDLDILDDLMIVGLGPELTVLDAGQIDRALHVHAGVTLTLQDLTIREGDAEDSDGGGILNQGGTVMLDRILLVCNQAARGGGGGQYRPTGFRRHEFHLELRDDGRGSDLQQQHGRGLRQ